MTGNEQKRLVIKWSDRNSVGTVGARLFGGLDWMTVKEKLEECGYEGVVIFENYSYDSAFIGVTSDNRAAYDFDKMVEYLVHEEGFESYEEAVEWITYNTERALPYMGKSAPVIIYGVDMP